MKKKIIKIISIILVSIATVFILQNATLAASSVGTLLEEVKTDSASWKDADANSNVAKTTQNIVGTAINVIRIVGTGIAIIMITYVAIKYMSAAPSEKAEFKKSATAMIVGAIVLFAATNILKIIADFATTNIGA